jgi:hypothetical protein
MFCIIDIVHHRHKVKIPTNNLNRLVSNQISVTGDVRLAQNKLISTASEANQESSTTPCINLQLFDVYEEDKLDDNDNEQPEITANKQSTDNKNTRPNSLDNLSRRSSVMDTARDVLTRRHALDPIEQKDLRTYMRRRKNSIVQHVIGYNYDDNSSVGGLYTRVGIGSKLNRSILVIIGHLNGSF